MLLRSWGHNSALNELLLLRRVSLPFLNWKVTWGENPPLQPQILTEGNRGTLGKARSLGVQRPKVKAGEQPGGLLLRQRWGRRGRVAASRVGPAHCHGRCRAEGWQEGTEACSSAGPAWSWRPYLVSAVPGARQRAVARAGRPVCEVPRQLVQDGRGVVPGARRHGAGSACWGSGAALAPAAPPAAAATSCRAGRRHLAPAAQVRPG